MRAVVDSNVWVSALLNPAGPPAAIRTALQNGKFTLIASEPLLAELSLVLWRPRLVRKYGVTPASRAALITLLLERAEIVPVTGTVRLCRDPNDDQVIETALNGRADVLVTRDDDLKGEAELVAVLAARGLAVLTVRRFLELLNSQPAD